MSKLRRYLSKLPIISWLVDGMNAIRLPGMEGLTVFNLWEIYSVGILKGALGARANAISYSFFMAMFPFILFVLNLIPFIAIENFQGEFLAFVNELLPAQAAGSFDDVFKEIALKQNGGLLTISFFSSLFLMANGVNAIFAGFENSYYVETSRNWLKQYGVALGVSVMLAVFLLIGVIFTLFVEYWLNELRTTNIMTDDSLTGWLGIVRYALLVFMLFLFVAVLYYTGTKDGRKTRFFSMGALVTTLLVLLLSYLYGLYIENFSSYNELYGSIGALIILMVYIWLNANLLLLGYELNVALRKLKARNLNNDQQTN
jgi:membrane protein